MGVVLLAGWDLARVEPDELGRAVAGRPTVRVEDAGVVRERVGVDVLGLAVDRDGVRDVARGTERVLLGRLVDGRLEEGRLVEGRLTPRLAVGRDAERCPVEREAPEEREAPPLLLPAVARPRCGAGVATRVIGAARTAAGAEGSDAVAGAVASEPNNVAAATTLRSRARWRRVVRGVRWVIGFARSSGDGHPISPKPVPHARRRHRETESRVGPPFLRPRCPFLAPF